jgi:hypothetical protein
MWGIGSILRVLPPEGSPDQTDLPIQELPRRELLTCKLVPIFSRGIEAASDLSDYMIIKPSSGKG